MVRLLNGWAAGFFRISVLVLVHTHGWQRSFQPVAKARIRLFSSGTETTSARCRAWRSMSPNHASCRRRTNTGQMRCWHINQVRPRGRVRREAHLEPRVLRQPGSYLGGLVRGVVVHHQTQIPWGVGSDNLLEEGQELLALVPRLARRGDVAGGDLQGRKQGGGPVPVVAVDARRRPGCIGEPGAVRSRAWMCWFSSRDSTTAFSGGAR